ncbi:hypothetical protein ABT294_19005 [Nonomuraea sp. NPDC000554]|uniref:hypothetical protein n=1 Tax=Nonomuraea sp. NPDC000554 TaxID=3154259 RepID=UPI003321744B
MLKHKHVAVAVLSSALAGIVWTAGSAAAHADDHDPAPIGAITTQTQPIDQQGESADPPGKGGKGNGKGHGKGHGKGKGGETGGAGVKSSG